MSGSELRQQRSIQTRLFAKRRVFSIASQSRLLPKKLEKARLWYKIMPVKYR